MCGRYVVTNSVNKTTNIVKKVINVDNSENYNTPSTICHKKIYK